MSNSTNTHKPSVQLRLAWMERYAIAHGNINRKPYMKAWGLSPAQASSDLQALLAALPERFTYHTVHKTYLYKGPRKPTIKLPKLIAEHLTA